MIKKVFLTCGFIILLIIGAVFIPWDKLPEIKSLFIKENDEVSSLKIYSLGGDMKIFIDNEEKDVIYEKDSYKEIFPISIGKHTVKLERISSSPNFYPKFEREIEFINGFETVISWEIGPSEASSSGWILNAKKNDLEENQANLFLSISPSDAEIDLNGENIDKNDLGNTSLSLDKQYIISASKTGYVNLEFEFLPEDQQERLKLAGFDLYLDINLYKIPIESL